MIQPPTPPPPAPMRPVPPAPVPYAPAATPSFTVAETKDGPGYLVRALWFLLVGWWATAIVSALAWLALITIIGLPLGIYLVNRLPTVLTLRPRTSTVSTWTDADGRTMSTVVRLEQVPWPARGVWFVFVGWWASGLVMSLGYLLVLTIIGLPLGLMVFNRVPFVASLYRY